MISLSVRNKSGQSVGSYEFDPNELAPGINKQLLHDVVVMYETNRRVGTVSTRNRGRVQGSTKKLFRQKGTGRARMGPVRSPIRKGGGVAFARDTVDYGYRLPQKAVRLATRMALLSKFLDNQVTLLDELTVTEPKTSVVAGILKSLDLSETACLLTIAEHDANIWRSARNIENVWVSTAGGLNAYDLLHQKQLVITRGALDQLRSRKPVAAAAK
ncbi:MAG: 50S ribosomal protein L4 [Planctomycetaceae bacterium]